MPRVFTTRDGFVAVDLLRSSIDHFKAAAKLFDSSPSYFDSAGYLAHLSVELLFKAWLLHSAGGFKGTHVLADLHGTLSKACGAQILSVRERRVLALLDKYAQLRYPDLNNPTEVGDAHFADIQTFVQSIVDQLPNDLLLSLEKINLLQKGGRVLMKKKIARTRK